MSWFGMRSRARLGFAGALCLASAVACGGKVDGEGGDDTPAEPGNASGGAPSQSGSNAQPAGTELPPCHLGFDPNFEPTRSCDWLGDELCYSEKLEACACVCPRKRDSLCSSGFPMGPNGKTKVTCN